MTKREKPRMGKKPQLNCVFSVGWQENTIKLRHSNCLITGLRENWSICNLEGLRGEAEAQQENKYQ